MVRNEPFGLSIYDKVDSSFYIAKGVRKISGKLVLKTGGKSVDITQDEIDYVNNKVLRSDILAGPTNVEIYPTMFCNERCSFCCVGHALTKEQTAMDIQTIDAMAKKFREIGVFDVSILGGEPFLFKNLEYMVDAFSKTSTKILISTNGTVLNKNLYRKFATLGLVKINLSFHSHVPEIENRIVNNPIAFKRLIETMEFLKSINYNPHTSIVVNRLNVAELHETVEFLCKSGTSGIALFHTMGAGFVKENNNIGVDFWEYAAAVKKSKKIAERYSVPLSITSNYPFLVDETMEFNADPELRHLIYGTSDGRQALYVNYDGEVYPTSYEWGSKQLSLGNILTGDLKYMWNFSPIIELFRAAKPPKICETCRHFEYCRGGTVLNYNIPLLAKQESVICPLVSKVNGE